MVFNVAKKLVRALGAKLDADTTDRELLPPLRETVGSDVFRYFGRRDSAAVVHGFLRIPGFRHTTFLRASQKYGPLHPVGAVFRACLAHSSTKYGFQIPVGVKLGEGFYIGHHGTIVINRDAVVGRNCNIAVNCTIGQQNRGKGIGVPVLGDCVWIGTGAIIVGGITIGDNVLIAPGAYVNQDVPSNSLVLGNPATVRVRGPEVVNGYINRRA